MVVLESERNYIITWVDHDGTVLEIDQEVQRGTIPTFDGTIPARNGFDFIGWDPEVTEAFSDQIYTAQYAAIADTHKITWKNWDGTLLVESMVYSGQTPVYSGPIPTKESDDYYDYMFIGWSPKLEPANYIRTYTAQFAGTKRVYTVTWIDTSVYNPDTNSYRVLYTEEVEAGTTPIYVGAQPTKPDDQNWGYKYIFDGWNPMPAHLTKDMEYKTNYVRAYDVRWYNWYNEPELLKEERLKMVEVTKPSGYTTMEIPETIEYDGPTPTIPDDYGYTYRFKGWFRLDSPLGNDNKMADREYIATYDCISKDDRYDPSKFEHYYGRYGSLPDCRITNYTGDFYADFYIPTWLDGEMVTGIDMVYDDSHPVGVRGAFEDNNRIVNLYLGDNLDEFNHNTFRGCTNLQNIHFGKNMKYLGLWMFENCTSLSSVTIPEQIEKIDWGAFCGCTNLLTVTFSEGLEIIETLAFSECANLTTITLPNSLTHVDGFDGCTRLHTVNLGAGVTWILDWCFAGNVALQNINLGEVNLEYIGSYAFKDCSSLTKVDLPETLKTIGNHAFLRCTSLNEVNFKGTIPQLESIDDWAFLECSELRSLSIPASVIRIGEGIVGSCEKLSSLEVSHANQKYRSKDNMIIDIEKEKIIAGCNASGDIPTDHTVTVIGTGAFYDCKTYNQNKTLIIPSNIKKIEGSAFYQCIGLPSIDPYEIVFTDHDRHYEDCPKSIIIPSTVEVIESLAFHLDYFPEEGEKKDIFVYM
ncbi:MAG TPA: leucine-rich repeat domain-containing protein [Gallicola sp.]|nr:leucine-rich repeat domain-containing protein [Gallicola sp.]